MVHIPEICLGTFVSAAALAGAAPMLFVGRAACFASWCLDCS